MTIKQILFSTILTVSFASNAMENVPFQPAIDSKDIEKEYEAPNSTTILTHDTKIYGIPLKDVKTLRENWYKEGTKARKTFETPICTINPATGSVEVIRPLQDTLSDYPIFYSEETEQTLNEGIEKGTAHLCNNVAPSKYLSYLASSYAILLDSSDCEKLRQQFEETDKMKQFFDKFNQKRGIKTN